MRKIFRKSHLQAIIATEMAHKGTAVEKITTDSARKSAYIHFDR